MTPAELQQLDHAIRSGNFAWLVGKIEDQHLEAKALPAYDLGTPAGRYELAKDVTAFANSEGGWILIGPQTVRVATSNSDQIEDFILSDVATANVAQLAGVIRTHTYPEIRSLEIFWAPSDTDPALGIGAIFVPPQTNDSKPFLITKVAEDGAPLKEIVCGFARRVDADNVPFTASELYQNMRIGSNSMAQRLTRIEEKLDKLSTPIASGPRETDAELQQRIDARIDRMASDE